MVLVVETSKQPSIDCTVLLLVSSLMELYNEMEQAEHGKIQNA